MPHDPQRLKSALDNVLTVAASTLATPPARQVVTPGVPAYDCEQLAVWCASLRSVGMPQPGENPGARSQPRQRIATLGVLLLGAFCYGPNLAEDPVTTAGRRLAVDGWSLFCGLLDAIHGDTLLPTATFGATSWARDLTIAEVQRQEGDRAGWLLSMQVGI
jgi:hypothetical protein